MTILEERAVAPGIAGDGASDPAAFDYESVELPPQLGWSRRLTKLRWFDQYKRLLLAVTVANLVVLGLAVRPWGWFSGDGIELRAISLMVLINLTTAVIFRNQYVVNLLFRIATSVPTTWPLRLRWPFGKVYHFGGLHSGGATAATVWYAIFVGSLIYHQANGLGSTSIPLLVVTGAILALLVGLVVMALPKMRSKHHDAFELVHRLGGWGSLVLFWIQTVLVVRLDGSGLLRSEAFWLLVVVTASVVSPWLRLKKVDVDIVRPSNHVALARFDYGVKPIAGSSTPLSRSPLTEWHHFANVPHPDADGFRLTISRSGDWTGAFIDDMPERIWVKGIPTAGVGNVDQIFKRVLWVATGSGIGPCLPHLLAQEVPAHLVWSTRTPRVTYGDDLVDEILGVQPNAVIWDTVSRGKPDMLRLAYRAYEDFHAEAVIVIANQSLTRLVVEGFETRGIPAYGAIWDS